jgi:hypothetical protein
MLSDGELGLDGAADIASEGAGAVDDGLASEEDGGVAVSFVLGAVLGCVVSELGGELSGAVPAACCRAQPDASARALSDKTTRARFIAHLITGRKCPADL